ncbi:uncharacterized protein LOC130191013 [Pseudoliparis swirei]|uniref:uncharacterized protein LOC130191013 n=1 Tax=Pseudoliparis swirei TaxID=2059687 RepID=UPI0024BE88EE|nr:uncharacterized protein LOC130191013 [Pseudoliparis swirei]
MGQPYEQPQDDGNDQRVADEINPEDSASNVSSIKSHFGPLVVVVVHGRRTAIGKAKRGAFKDTTPDELLSAVMRAVLADVGLPPDRLGDVCVGNVLQPGAGAVMARVAHFLSGFPDTVPCYTVNRQCSSGLQAVFNIAVRPGRRQLRVPRHVLWRAGGGSGGDPDPRRGAPLVPGHAERLSRSGQHGGDWMRRPGRFPCLGKAVCQIPENSK